MQAAPASANRGFSLIQDCGYYSTACGYCKEEDSSSSTGMQAHRLTVYDYQELLDQGWRRSGKFLYKPDNQVTCCRQYSIRLDVTDFQPSKAHRKLMRKWEQYLAGDHPHEQQQSAAAAAPGSQLQDRDTASPKRARTTGSSMMQQPRPSPQQQQQRQQSFAQAQLLDEVRLLLQAAVRDLHQAAASGCALETQLLPAVKVLQAPHQHQQQQQGQQQGHKHKPHNLPPGTLFTSPCAHALAAAVRKQSSHNQQQQQQAGLQSTATGSCVWGQPEQLASSLADRFNALAAQGQGSTGVQLTAASSKGHINFVQQQGTQHQQQQADTGEQQQVQAAQQQAGHKHQGRHATQQSNGQQQQQQQQQAPPVQPHRLQVVMVPNQFIQVEFELWQKYQSQQHHEQLCDLTRAHFKGFLVDTPLIQVNPPAPAQQQGAEGQAAGAAAGMPSCGYGSFHQQYWLDGKLVAVGVVDVLPRCLSSKYFFWDPEYAWLSLGRYGALREIQWVAEQHAAGAADLCYYYLGYYIHTCPKMAYKAEYPPSELLCPKRQVWVRVDDAVRTALDQSPYVVLSDLPGVQMQPNLSVPRQPPPAAVQQEAAASTGAFGLQGSAAAMPQHLSTEQLIEQRQRERQALDAQLLFIMKQPVRWGALRDSGMLNDEDICDLEERLTAWRAAVGETAKTLLYAAAHDMLAQ